jgi:hypothetical protein
MANKPERFSQDEIRREKISPEELDSWVRYVQEEKYEAVKNAGIEISREDIRIIVHLRYSKIDTLVRDVVPDVNGVISVETVRPGGFVAFYVIAPFASSLDAKETFEDYAKFKNVSITERDEVLSARREISV